MCCPFPWPKKRLCVALAVLVCTCLTPPAIGQRHTLASGYAVTTQASVAGTPVLFDHDGGIDDFISLLILLAQPRVKMIGITILDGDCFADVAANTTLKLLNLLQRADIPVAVSTLPAVNPFPDAYRAQGIILDVLPLMNQHVTSATDLAALKHAQLQATPGQEWFAQTLLQQQEPVTIVATGPLSNLAYALSHYPQVADKVAAVWWMGGALRVPGNVYQPGTDGSAEWNAFWDPAALGVVFNSSVPLTLVPLDGTNRVPITPDLVYAFGPPSATSLYAQLAGTFYAPVVNWVATSQQDSYFAWDALTAACMLDASLCTVEGDLEVSAVLSGPGQGATVLTGKQQQQQQTAHHQQPHHQQGQQQPPLQRHLSWQPLAKDRLGSSVAAAASAGGAGASVVHAAATAAGSGGSWQPDLAAAEPQLSARKRVSAVVDVSPAEFQRFMLAAMRK